MGLAGGVWEHGGQQACKCEAKPDALHCVAYMLQWTNMMQHQT